jgi:peptidyl-prolyl cis-trans isomerase SurA
MFAEKWLKTGRNAFAVLAAFGLAAAPVAQAQDNPTEDASGLNLPSVIEFLGENNPNFRSAAAKVNGTVITGTDIDHRVALVLAANEQEISEEEEVRLRLQVLNNLIDETLQIQEATALEIPVSAEEVDQTYERVATQNFGRTVEALNEYLDSIGSSNRSLKRQIEGELAWTRILRRNIQPFISVSEEEVNELLERLKASKGTSEYRLGEIFLSATDQDRDEVRQNAARIVEQLQQGGSFVAYARQFSQASTAAVGGDLGWIQLPQ